MRVAFAGGGTGGHIYPSLAIDAALRADCAARGEEYTSIFYGTRGGLESQIAGAAGATISFVPSRPLLRRFSSDLARTIAANAAGIGVASLRLLAFRPDIVVASGGYVCFPVVVAARGLRLARRIDPVLALLEENALPGLTNKLLAPLVDEVWGPMWVSASAFKTRYVTTGIPVRASFSALPPRPRARERLGIDPHATVILIIGGSQGARSINEAASALVTRRALPSWWWVLHLSGERDFEYMKAELREKQPGNRVTLVPYLDDPAPAYAAADIVVARAGGSTLAELATTGRPAVLIPYPHAAEDHQTANARFFAEVGAARLVNDAELNDDVLWWALSEVLTDDKLATMAKATAALAPTDAAALIVRRINTLRQGKRARRDEHRVS